MPRQPRYYLPGVPQHVIQRGNNRQAVFFAEEDYTTYLGYLKEAAARHGCDIHAYVLMTNHVHLLVTAHKGDGIAKTMQSLGRKYVSYINRLYQRSGTLWEGRYKASLVESERYLLTCYRYIELNPVRAGMVQHPGDYPWSSYLTHAQGKPNPIVTDHGEYLRLGQSPEQRQHAYRALFQYQIEPDQVHGIRAALNQCRVLGGERFKDEIEQQLDRRVRPGKPGRPRKQSGDDAGQREIQV